MLAGSGWGGSYDRRDYSANALAITASILMLLILIPFFAFRSLGEVVDERTLLRLFFEPRRQIEKA